MDGLSIDGRIILNWTFMTEGGVHVQDLSGSGYERVISTCDCGDESSGSKQ